MEILSYDSLIDAQTGNSKGMVQVMNLSTGKGVQVSLIKVCDLKMQLLIIKLWQFFNDEFPVSKLLPVINRFKKIIF